MMWCLTSLCSGGKTKMSSENTALANISKARKYLDQAKSLSEILEIRSEAVAAEAYMTARGADEAAQIATEIKLRSERKAGAFLQETELNKGGNPNLTKDIMSPVAPTLKELGIKPQESKRWQRIANIPEEKFEDYLVKAKKRTQSALLSLAVGAHVGQATGESEWYTPKKYIDAARKLMGTIDIDPASSDVANKIIEAATHYTAKDDGLTQEWTGNVWMNPPYSQPFVTQFCDLLVEKYVGGEVDQACVLVNNATETEFYQNMMNHCNAICFIKGRVKFIDEEGNAGGAPLQGQTILYFGENVGEFGSIFSEFGVVLYVQ